MTTFQLISYINKIKAQSKFMIKDGRRIKSYDVPGTEDFKKIFDAREELFKLVSPE